MTQELVQVLGEDGVVREKKREPKLSRETLVRIHRAMVVTRVMNERGMKLQRQGRINFYIGAEGQEAAHVGFAAALDDQDWYFPHYRDLGVAAYRGARIGDMVNQMYASRLDPTKGRQMPNHFSFRDQRFVSISSPLTTQVPQAVGAAYAAKLRRDGRIVGVTFGDGSTSEGDFHCGMNFAGVWKVPCVFVCQNNHWAISVPLPLQSATPTFAEKAQAYGFEGVRVDGNDVLAVYAACKDAADKARAGGGPTLIETYTYRMGPHSSSDDPTRYVPKADLDAWRKKDPIARFRHYLESKGHWDDKQEAALGDSINGEIDAAIKQAEAAGPPPVDSIVEDVLAEVPWHLREQLDDLKRFWGE